MTGRKILLTIVTIPAIRKIIRAFLQPQENVILAIYRYQCNSESIIIAINRVRPIRLRIVPELM
jgi:aspartate/methionine/tyrosine aminotransferase